ncbi:MAG: S-layer homology domain-containing protein [Marinisporobacter sp.]|jgi:methionine-rich copper-binding protein CopC|nr:S-layer homology domain-containing protein [Marinisporobacter sp.]
MIKKNLSLFLVFAILFSLLGFSKKTTYASGAHVVTVGDVRLGDVAGGVEIENYDGPAGDIIIPSTLDGKSVVSIGYYSFYQDRITSVTIPDTVTYIGECAFAVTDLTSVTIPDSVTSIDKSAFTYNDSLTSVTIGDSVTSTGEGAFSDCEKLKSVTFKGMTAPNFFQPFEWQKGCFDGIGEGAIAYIPDKSTGYDNTIYPFINGSPLKLLSKECDITEWKTPTNLTVSELIATKKVDYPTKSITVDVGVSDQAEWKLYSDKSCTQEMNKTINLEVGNNTSYIKVTAEDGATTKVYTLTVVRLPKDSLAPYITETTPANNELNTALSKTIEITFSENIFAGSKIEMMTLKNENSVVEYVYGIDTNKLTINPKSDLKYGTVYTLTIPEHSVTDAVYNQLADDYILNFTTEKKPTEGSSSSGGGSSPKTSESEKQTAKTETIKEENGRKKVELVVDSEIINKKIEEATTVVEIPVAAKDVDSVITILTGDIVKRMEKDEFKLSIKIDDINYIIPAKEVRIDQVSKILDVEENLLKNVKIKVQIEKLDTKSIQKIIEKAKAQNYEIVFRPVEFKVLATTTSTTGKVKSTEISKFKNYVERIMEIPEGVDPRKITTGIVYNVDGTFSHIPTEVFKKDGKYFAKLNSLTNSSYSIIWNPITVSSVENHWSKTAVNDMASRLVIKNPETFKPDTAITRGEFAEYITKALGLYRTHVAKASQFTDVEIRNELADAITIAVDYGIISGYPDGTFKPEAKISREEAMTMYAKAMDIVKLSEVDNNKIKSYKDKEKVSPWAYKYVKKTVSANVFNGRTKETIVPQGTFTYAEAVTAIRNLLIESKLINKF